MVIKRYRFMKLVQFLQVNWQVLFIFIWRMFLCQAFYANLKGIFLILLYLIAIDIAPVCGNIFRSVLAGSANLFVTSWKEQAA